MGLFCLTVSKVGACFSAAPEYEELQYFEFSYSVFSRYFEGQFPLNSVFLMCGISVLEYLLFQIRVDSGVRHFLHFS